MRVPSYRRRFSHKWLAPLTQLFSIFAVAGLFATASPAQNAATFVTADTTTQGNWIGTYGADGYAIANGPQSPANGTLPYGSYSVLNELNWTYAASSSDPRALETDAQGDRMASTWYSIPSFNFDVNLTDANRHQVALYLLDWDRKGRGEIITIKDYVSGSVLDTRIIPDVGTNTIDTNFQNGTYLLWNISGHVTITVTVNAGPNAVVAGIFFGQAGQVVQTAPIITSANATTFTVGQSGSFTVSASGSPTPSFVENGTLPTGVTFVDNHNGTGTLSGPPTTNAASPYQISFTASNGVLPNAVQSFTFTVNPQIVGGGSSAAYLSADTITQGNWIGTYGADGYDIANGPHSPANGTLPYGSYSVSNQSNWTYFLSSSDPRALETDAQGDRIVSSWYSISSFNFDVNFTDANKHQVALYLLDWDHKGRGEIITIKDYVSGSVLDTRIIPDASTNTIVTNFQNGTYLLWNISGHVTITVTVNSGPNAVVAGIFFGQAGQVVQTAPIITSANATTFTVGQSGSFTVSASGSPTPSFVENGTLPTGVTFLDNHNGTGTLSGPPTTNAASPYQVSFTASNGVLPNAVQSFTLTVNPQIVGGGSSAAYLSADTITQGNWIGTYGADGYDIANGPQSPANGTLPYGSYSVSNQSNWTYFASSSDPRALETDAQGDRIVSSWYSISSFNFDVNFTDANKHQVALYLLDWDHKGRGEIITIKDYVSGSVLDTRIIPDASTNTIVTNFQNGTYLLWNISGHVTITVTVNSGPNAVVAGIFFGQAGQVVQTAPIITSANATTFTVGQSGSFTVSASGSPTPSFVENGTLPTGVTFVDNHNGTGTLSGPPTTNAASPYQISFTASNGVLPNAVQNFTLTVNPQVVNTGGGTATFLTFDTATQGNWIGTYGLDGYMIADSAQSLPSYDPTFSVKNPDNGNLWGSPVTSDPRALQIPGASRMATEWNSLHTALPPTFGFDVNITDGNRHLFALYALDWLGEGRAEMVQVFDANSKILLDTRYISNFQNGVYALWTLSGHVIVNVTETTGVNCVISGVFFGGNALSAVNVGLTTPNINLPPGQSQQFSTLVSGTTNANVTWSISPAGLGTINSSTGYYTAPASITGTPTVTVTATSSANPQKRGSASVKLTNGGVGNFLASDTGTKGAYQGVYGADYTAMIGGAGSMVTTGALNYGSFSVTSGQPFVWSASTNDSRAPGGVASSWLNPSFHVTVTDGKLHQLALYALDWDNQNRAETIQIVDTASGTILDSRSISNFSNGVYLIWNISGNITINVNLNSGPNSVISAAFFGGAIQSNSQVSPPSVSLSAGQSQQLSTNLSGSVTWAISSVKPSGAPSGSFSNTTPGLYSAPAQIVTATTVTITATANGVSASATVILVPHATASSPASLDTSTQGSWRGHYGSKGYSIAGDAQNLPAYATFSVTDLNGVWAWTNSTTDVRALQNGANNGRIAAAWYKNHESFTMNFNFTDGQVHQLSLYVMDWDLQNRTESIQIVDADTGQVLDTEFLANFANGLYLTWSLSGHFTINVTNDGGANAVVNGVFFQ